MAVYNKKIAFEGCFICKINYKGILLILFEMFKLHLFLRRHFPKNGAQRDRKNDFFLLYTATIITPSKIAAERDETADDSITNVTGSNSVF